MKHASPVGNIQQTRAVSVNPSAFPESEPLLKSSAFLRYSKLDKSNHTTVLHNTQISSFRTIVNHQRGLFNAAARTHVITSGNRVPRPELFAPRQIFITSLNPTPATQVIYRALSSQAGLPAVVRRDAVRMQIYGCVRARTYRAEVSDLQDYS
jgi:hypothetical protein